MAKDKRPHATKQKLQQPEAQAATATATAAAAAATGATEESPAADPNQQSAVVLAQQPEAPETAIPLNAKWTMWFDHPRLAPAGSE